MSVKIWKVYRHELSLPEDDTSSKSFGKLQKTKEILAEFLESSELEGFDVIQFVRTSEIASMIRAVIQRQEQPTLCWFDTQYNSFLILYHGSLHQEGIEALLELKEQLAPYAMDDEN